MRYEIELTFITPLFSHGATDAPEIRAASIRGMLHQWFRMLGGDVRAERAVFGGVKQKMIPDAKDCASKVVVRVAEISAKSGNPPTLPHKSGGQASPRNAFMPGSKCKVIISDRLGGIPEAHRELFRKTVHAWLLMGTLGFRSTRGAGSFVWESHDFPYPPTAEAYAACCKGLVNQNFKVALLEADFRDAESARRMVSDSLGGRDRPNEADSLSRLHDPLGKILRGRKTSPLKYRIVRLGNAQFHILTVWDARQAVTGNSSQDLRGVITLLAQRKPQLGEQLQRSVLNS